MTGVADDTAGAAVAARDKLKDAMSFRVGELQSLTFVEATIGDARALFGDELEYSTTQDPPSDEARAVIFVAHGRFVEVQLSDRFSQTPPPWAKTAWIVVAVGHPGTRIGTSNQTYELSRLGDVHQVPLPLPPVPTPVLPAIP